MMKKILISDIKETEVISYVKALSRNENVVQGTAFGSQILQLFEKLQPDVVILGSCVCSDNDIEIIKELKEKNKDVKIIVLGHSKELEKELLEAGASNFLIKPVNGEQLLFTVNN